MTRPDESLGEAARAAARMLGQLSPGPLAEIRRMDDKSGAPFFWRLAARHPQTIGQPSKQREWIAIVRILAILTERGDPAHKRTLHDAGYRLGAVLCNGGDRDWSPSGGVTPRPVFSERRLTQLMAARGPQRAVLLERAARSLARSRKPGCGIDVVDIALTLLVPDDGRRLAEPYYRCLDRAELAAENSDEGTV